MKIQTVTLQNFRKFNNATFKFESGVNIIAGPNESGKSSLMAAIKVLFFADPTRKSKLILNSISPWHNSFLPVLEMEFSFKDVNYRLIKDFEKRSAVLSWDDNKQSTNDIVKIHEIIAKSLGIANREVYESTAAITHEDISKLKKNDNFLTAIQNAASSSGSDGDVQIKLNEIDKEIAELQKGTKSAAKTPGPIKMLRDNYASECEKLRILKSEWENVKRENVALENAQKRLKIVNEKVKELSQLIENNRRYDEAIELLERNQKELERIHTDIVQIQKYESDLLKLKIELEKYKRIEKLDLDETVIKMAQIESDVKSKRKQVEDIKMQITDLSLMKSNSRISKLVFVFASIFVLANVGLILASKIIILLVLWIISAVFVYIFWQISRGSVGKRIDELEKSKTEIEEVIKTDEIKIDNQLSELGLESFEQLKTAKSQVMQIRSDISQTKSAYDALLRSHSQTELQEIENKLILRKKEIEISYLTDEVKHSKLSPTEYLRKSNEFEKLQNESKNLQQSITISTTRVRDSRVNIDDIKSLENEIEILQRKLSELEHKLRVLITTKEIIEAAIQDTSTMAAHILRKDIEKYIAQITTRVYSKVRLTDELDLEVYSEAKNDWVEPHGNLSSGTIDQVFFLLRLAFVRLIAKEGLPVLLLDDPFLTFDNNRLSSAFKLLNEIASDYQILIFTREANPIGNGTMIRI